jgi:integrase
MSTHQLPDGRWICKFPAGTIPDQPARTKEYFGRGQEAERAARRRNIELGVGVVARKVTTPSFAELATKYLEARRETVTAATYTPLVYMMARAITPIIGQLQAHEIDHNALDSFVSTRRKNGIANRTIRGNLLYIKAVLNYSVAKGLIMAHCMNGYPWPRSDSKPLMPPNRAEFEAILAHAAPHVRRCMLICYYTGARPGPIETYGLKWQAVDFFNKTITITSAQKGGISSRQIDLADRLHESLLAWKQEDISQFGGSLPANIIHYKGRPVTGMWKGFARAKERAGITRRLRWYDLRHMTATELIASGVDIKTISEILGNTPEQCLQTYAHIRTPQKKSAIDQL